MKQMGYDISNKKEVKAIKKKFEPKMKEFQPIDSAIYDHFYQKFMDKWKEYGVKKMVEDVEKLMRKTKQM